MSTVSIDGDPAPDQWYWTFGENDGYDAMWAAYSVYRGDMLMFRIETAEFVDEPVTDYAQQTAPNARAEALARAVCQRMQGY